LPNVDANDLYGLALDRFVPERTALARELRKQGRREDAGKVAALRKPSVAAWAVNQLVRTQGQAVAELFATGDELREAHQKVVSGHGDGRMLAAAARREREAVDSLMDGARGLLTSEGHELSDATIERVSDTLHAAALDQDARATVRDGRLQHELRHVGFGEALAADGAPARRRADRKPPAAEAGAARRASEAETSRAADAEAARASEAETRRVALAKRKADRAARALRAAQERRDRAAQALRDADEELASARAQAEAAARELS
jgi:hypothetical protein